ncbi:hypothetical protein [Rubritalea tangerina]
MTLRGARQAQRGEGKDCLPEKNKKQETAPLGAQSSSPIYLTESRKWWKI